MALPTHWKTVPLRELIITRKGKKPLKLLDQEFEGSVPYLDIAGAQSGESRQFADKYSSVLANKNDILIVMDGSRSGLVLTNVEGAVGSTILLITPLVINQLYLFYFLKYNYDNFNDNTLGASIPHLDLQLLYSLEVPTPPPSEQKLIAKKLTENLDHYKLDSIQAENEIGKIEDYKRSIFNQAIKGDLTSKWREAMKIKKDQAMDDLNGISKTPVINKENIFNCPPSWINTNADTICSKITDGEHTTPARYSEGELLLTAKNIRDGFIDYSNVSYISNEDFVKSRSRCKPEKNDVLMVCVGSTLGRVALLREEVEFAITRTVALLKPKISGEYLMIILQTPFMQEIIKAASKGAAQPQIFISELKNLPIPLPSIPEQEEIVKQINIQVEGINQIISKNVGTLEKLKDLEKALYKLAFQGELVKSSNIEKDWFDAFLETVKKKFNEITMNNNTLKKANTEQLKILKESLDRFETIENILTQSGGVPITIEDLWNQSKYKNSASIEEFYEELESLISKENKFKKVSWSFTDANKNQVVIKTSNHEN